MRRWAGACWSLVPPAPEAARRLGKAICLVLALGGPAAADVVADAEAAAEAIRRASARLEAAEGARDQRAVLAEAIRAHEAGLAALRAGLRAVALRRIELETAFDADRERMVALVSVLQGLGTAGEAEVLLHPDGPLGAARAGMLLGDVTPAVLVEARRLRARLEELEAVKRVRLDAEARLRAGLEGLQTARRALIARTPLRDPLPSVTALRDEAASLDGFAAAVAALGGTAETPLTPVSAWPAPLPGEILREAGEADAAGVTRPGIVIAAPPRSLVSAPVRATVRFAGSLLDYDKVVMLEPQSGLLIVLAGLSEVTVAAGEVVDAGAGLGLLAGEEPPADAQLSGATEGRGATGRQTLYMDVRESGRPVPPDRWFALGDLRP